MKLAICIPTINRFALLKQTTESVLPQLHQEMRLYISNNASIDRTQEYLLELAKKFPQIKITNWLDKVEVDQSMERAAQMAEDEYIFLLGDDDVLLPNAVRNIINELKTDPDVLILNGFHTTKDLSVTQEHLPQELKGKTFNNVSEAFSSLWNKMPFSSFVAKKKCLRNFHTFYGTSHAYSGTVWYYLAHQLSIHVRCTSQPMIMIRNGEKTWTPRQSAITLYEIPKWFSLLEKLPKLKNSARLCRSIYLRDYLQPYMMTHMISELRKADFGMFKIFKVLPWEFRWKFFKYGKLLDYFRNHQ